MREGKTCKGERHVRKMCEGKDVQGERRSRGKMCEGKDV
jgi:hypothetical protein